MILKMLLKKLINYPILLLFLFALQLFVMVESLLLLETNWILNPENGGMLLGLNLCWVYFVESYCESDCVSELLM